MDQDLIMFLDQRYVLQQKPRQPLPLPIRSIGIPPQAREIRCQHVQPGAQLFVDCQSIFLAFPLILLLRFLESAKLPIPISLQRIRLWFPQTALRWRVTAAFTLSRRDDA